MIKEGVAKVFEGSAETGVPARRSLTARQIRVALGEVGYLDFCQEGNGEVSHILSRTVLKYDPDDLDNPYVPNPKSFPVKQGYEVSTVSALISNDLHHNASALRMMQSGFSVIAEAMQMQRSGLVEPRTVQAFISSAGATISAGFDFLNGGNNGLDLNKVKRPEATSIAQRLFKAGLNCN
jgi:hypothetical protein